MNFRDFLMQSRMSPGGQDYTLGSTRAFSLGPSLPPSRARTPADPPMPPPRPAMSETPPGPPMQLASAAPLGLLERLRAMPDFQSNGMPTLMQPQGPTPDGGAIPAQINWGDPDKASDFFSADRAMMMFPGLLGYGG